MSEKFDKLIATAVNNQQDAVEVIEKLFDVAQPGAVFGAPVTVGEHTVITASEVKVGMGFGFGSGGGTGTELTESEAADEDEAQAGESGSGFGVGGGGGGVSGGRPVAVISVGPQGVRVEPVVDATKVALAAFTTLGSMFLMLLKMRKASKG
jgi:uncharacterized spore protein YtfJ